MKTLDMTPLVYEGPMARAYLARLRHAGMRPKKLILMANIRHPTSGKPMGRWLPKPLREWYLAKVQRSTWPKRIKSQYPRLVQAQIDALNGICEGAPQVVDELTGPVDFRQYCSDVERVMTTGYRDTALAKKN